jgi:hypothetical protein
MTDAELFEFESLLVNRFKKFDFQDIEYDRDSENVTIKDHEIELLFTGIFLKRYRKDENGNIITSIYIFKILWSRYFADNKSVKLIEM